MRTLEKYLFSTRAMAVMLFIYAISMAIATFVENDYGTPAAKEMIYNALWFDVLQVLLIINFIFNIKRYRLWRREKWSLLLFHLAFIVIFIGAAITHLISVEGMMNIREGDMSNKIVSNQTYFKMSILDNDRNLQYETPYRMTYFNKKDASWPVKRTFKKKYQFKNKIIQLKTLDYIPLAKDTIIEDFNGKETLELVTIGQQGRKSVYLQSGETKEINGLMFTFNQPIEGTVQIFSANNQLYIRSPFGGETMQMAGQQVGMVSDSALLKKGTNRIKADTIQTMNIKSLYSVGDEQVGIAQFVLSKPTFKAKRDYLEGDKTNPQDQTNTNAIIVELSNQNAKDTIVVRGGQGNTGFTARTQFDGMLISLGFGSKIIKTPFAIKLRDFQLDHYPGSDKPSSFASEITIIDQGKEDDYRIYMNNVLDHGGYRFFQSSYDPDALGTRLSVNQDRPGTIVTYIGYFMLFTGMFLTLFWKGTRFWTLRSQLKKIAQSKATILLFFLIPFWGISQEQPTHDNNDGHNHSHENIPDNHANFSGASIKINQKDFTPIDSIKKELNYSPEHIQKLEHLLVQDDQGRIKPLGTHALELLRKIYKKDSYHGISATEWFLSVQQNPLLWANTPLIKVDNKINKKTRDRLGVEKGYTSLLNLIDTVTTEYKLASEYNNAFRRRPADRDEHDKEVLNVTERFTILDNIAKGYFLKIIPIQNDINETWTSWVKPGEHGLELDTIALGFTAKYLTAVKKAKKSNNWAQSDSLLQSISDYQQKWGVNVVPTKTKVNTEVFFNHLNIFFWLMIIYTVISAALIVLAFFRLFSTKKIFNYLLNSTLALLVITFVIHAGGLGLRWYISGHAPWSSGYEAVMFISWIGVLAGLLLYRNSNAFLPAAGALVAVIMMGFAHGGDLLNPQITPLVPVLKSYWLLVHVAIITASYGFFGLGMVLAIFVLTLYILKPNKKIKTAIKEITLVSEMSITIGLFALTVGTFLGGMWANESWGRYWSWDPKETWAFITVIVYAIVLHMRLVPGLRGNFTFNLAVLWAAASPIMTYFGVNYYLSGLHTYAAGDSQPIPAWVPITIVFFGLLSVAAYLSQRKYAKNKPAS